MSASLESPIAPSLRGAFVSGPVTTRDAALFTDLYEFTMAASYFREGMHDPATFSLFVRKLPKNRSFLIATGLEDVLGYLQSFRFSDDALAHLAGRAGSTIASSASSPTSGSRATCEPCPKGRSSFPMSRSWRSPRPSSKPSSSRRRS